MKIIVLTIQHEGERKEFFFLPSERKLALSLAGKYNKKGMQPFCYYKTANGRTQTLFNWQRRKSA